AASASASLTRSASEIERIAESRQRRQEILARDDAPEFLAIVDELALLRLMRTPDMAKEQLQHLIGVASDRSSTITLQVLPISAGLHAGSHGSFVILDFPDELDPSVVYLEARADGLYLEKPEQVEDYKKVFNSLQMTAMSEADSIDLMSELIH
ncbi:DUF5753 domain-containing protein, partial [Spinactinospora alkalitolerans]